MQSFLQYRNLGRQLREEYPSNRSDISSLSSNTQTSGSPDHLGREENVENTKDNHIEKALSLKQSGSAFSPSHSLETKSAERVSFQTALPLYHIRVVEVTDEVDVQDNTTTEERNEEAFIVRSGMKDEWNPRKWATSWRIWATVLIYLHGSFVGIASSIDSAALNRVRANFDVGEVTESLTIGLFLIGFGFGALFAGPLSESVGRNTVFIGSWTLYMLCVMASSLSPNIGFQLSFRFAAGFFGSAPLTCGGASIGDLWSPMERIYTFPVFANAALMGPIIGPVFGGYIGANTQQSWRWTESLDLNCAGVVLFLIFLTQRESFAPLFSQWKARHLRNITGDKRYQTEASMNKQPTLRRIRIIICRPFQITAREPILILLTCWLTLVWVIMFTFLSGYKMMFRRTYGTSKSQTGLCFIGMATGLVLSSATVPLITYRLRRDLHKARLQGTDDLAPESRLWYGLISAPAVPLALFWMAWTVNPSISIWSPLAASVLLGYGLLGMFTCSCEYIIHSYGGFSPAALSFNTFTRYIIAGIMVEVAPTMWRKLGISWSLTMLGCISTILCPVPYIFYVWGPKIRARSQYAQS